MSRRFALTLLIFLALLLGATDADAKRRKRRRTKKPAGPPTLVVLPFENDGKRGKKMAKSLALELELMDAVLVQPGKKLRRALKKKRDKAFETKGLKRAMKKRAIKIVVRGVRGYDDDGEKVIWVVVYDKNGKAGFFRSFALKGDTDGIAQEIGVALEPALSRWRKRKEKRVVFPPKPDVPESDADLFVDEDDGKGGRLDRLQKKNKKGGKGKGKKGKKKKPKKAKLTRSERDTKNRSASARSRKRQRLDDDAAQDEKSSDEGDESDKKGRKKRDRKKLLADNSDDDDGDKGEQGAEGPDLSHLIAVSLSTGAGAHYRSFSASNPTQSEKPFYRIMGGVQGRLSFWPIEWVGIDADVGLNVARFPVNIAGLEPASQFGLRPFAAAALKARYVLHLGAVGIGGGFRIGGRYLGQLVNEQRYSDGDLLTIYPSFHWYGLALGPEFFFSFILLGRRFEIEPRFDVVPLSVMLETPDWPGKKSLTLGWNAQTIFRAEIVVGVFAELSLWHTGTLSNWFDGAGTRRGRLLDNQSGSRAFVQGGTVLNLDEGLQAGLGWFW